MTAKRDQHGPTTDPAGTSRDPVFRTKRQRTNALLRLVKAVEGRDIRPLLDAARVGSQVRLNELARPVLD